MNRGPSNRRARRLSALSSVGAAVLLALCALPITSAGNRPRLDRQGLPERLADTGLYADLATKTVAADVLAFSPQYPLWTDGAAKRRWIRLPPGTAIDASNPDRWVFPVGTKLWKEFAWAHRVETRYMERGADGKWIYATYAWSADEADAVLVPQAGKKGACESAPGVKHDLPGRYDCLACHQGHPSEVLGFSALQLSPDRDPLALHGAPKRANEVDLVQLVASGLVTGFPAGELAPAPRIDAASDRERAVLGYLHSNCGACHNASGPLASLGMDLEQRIAPENGSRAIATTANVASRYAPLGLANPRRIVPGDPASSVLVRRIASRSAELQMPPLGTHAVDTEALALITAWIRSELAPRLGTSPVPVCIVEPEQEH